MNKKDQFIVSGLLCLMTVLFLTGWNSSVQCQEKYPTRAIDLICPFAPGAATDVVGRVFAAALNKKWGLPMNVINKSGGNSVPANVEVYNATPDGYTLMIDCQSSCSMLEAASRNLPFKVMDRTFIAMVSASPIVFIVPSASPIKSIKDLAEEAKRSPESFTWGSLGGAGMQDYGTRQFLKAIGVDVHKTKPIMAPGGAPVVVLTAGGHLKLGSSTTVGVLPAFKAGTVRPLALTGKSRHPDFPEVPTFEELGYSTITCYYWNGFSGPPKLPSHIVDVWNKVLQELFKDPEVISKVKNVGGVPFYKNAQEAREYVIKEKEDVEKLWGLK
jgi:tripartite-type tricarboxylate transporter receptor subunit TctC